MTDDIYVYSAIFLGALIISALCFLISIKSSWPYTLYPHIIRQRDIHVSIKPKIGGVIIIPLFILGVLLLSALNTISLSKELFSVLIASLVILFYGYIDEKYDLPWYIQILWQSIIAIIVIIGGIGLSGLNLPYDILWNLQSFAVGPFNIPRDIITFIWIIGLTNTVNWLDGLDGLAGGVGEIGFFILMLLALTPFVNQPSLAAICLLLAGLYGGFLVFNIYPSKIFLGTYGSMFLGFILAVISIIGGGKVATASLVLAFPIIDACSVILQRVYAQQSIFSGDNRHFHHKLLKIGLSQRQAVVIMWSISLIFGISALFLSTEGKLILFGAGLIIIITTSLILDRYTKIPNS